MAGEIIKAENVLKIGQRMEFFVDNDEERYTSRIEDLTASRIVAALPVNKKGVPVIPRKGSKVYALAVGDQCRYRFFATYLGSARLDERIPVWLLTFPETVERHQNREFVRVRVDLRVRARLVGEDGTEYVTPELWMRAYQKESLVPLVLWMLFCVFMLAFSCFGIALTRHPERYSPRIRRLIYQDGVLINIDEPESTKNTPPRPADHNHRKGRYRL